jgi:alpha-L-arabinofuranosidase
MAFASVYFEQRMRKVIRMIEETAAERGGRNVRIAMDEWNVRHCFWNEVKQYDVFRISSSHN